jgi:hypothetical protein
LKWSSLFPWRFRNGFAYCPTLLQSWEYVLFWWYVINTWNEKKRRADVWYFVMKMPRIPLILYKTFFYHLEIDQSQVQFHEPFLPSEHDMRSLDISKANINKTSLKLSSFSKCNNVTYVSWLIIKSYIQVGGLTMCSTRFVFIFSM